MKGGKRGGFWANVAAVKRAVRERDGQRCTKCGTTAAEHRARYGSTLQVHRLTPRSVYSIEGCVTLCIPCHGPEPRSPFDWCGGRMMPDGSRSFRIPESLYKQLEELAAQNGRTVAAEVQAALEHHLQRNGLWPPQP